MRLVTLLRGAYFPSCVIRERLMIYRVVSNDITERERCSVLGDSGGVVNSLDFCPASLKSLGCFYFRCVLSSQWKAVTVNLRILHCHL